eukprot:m.4594 g.4594  ORF g.4594 m.4594 type:complete len:299 (-) comp3025_c0_seq1:249-1145(-)
MSNAPSRRGHKPRIPSRATTANGVVPKAPRSLKTSVDSLVEQLKLANQKISQLEYENNTLKERLNGLRKARAATTKVIKQPTQFIERRNEDDVKLPTITSKASDLHAVCETKLSAAKQEIAALKTELENTRNSFEIKIDSLRNQLEAKIATAREMNADINRLQNECTELQGKSSVDNNKELLAKLKQAEEAARVCAHIAKTREEQIKDLQEELDTGAKKRKEMQSELTEMKSILKECLRDHEKKETKMHETLELMKVAWKKREDDWVAYNKKRDEAWNIEAKQWMDNAKSKLEELKKG